MLLRKSNRYSVVQRYYNPCPTMHVPTMQAAAQIRFPDDRNPTDSSFFRAHLRAYRVHSQAKRMSRALASRGRSTLVCIKAANVFTQHSAVSIIYILSGGFMLFIRKFDFFIHNSFLSNFCEKSEIKIILFLGIFCFLGLGI